MVLCQHDSDVTWFQASKMEVNSILQRYWNLDDSYANTRGSPGFSFPSRRFTFLGTYRVTFNLLHGSVTQLPTLEFREVSRVGSVSIVDNRRISARVQTAVLTQPPIQ